MVQLSTNEVTVDLYDRIGVMMEQESRTYCCSDYLNENNSSTSAQPCIISYVNEMWREKIAKWSYSIVDHLSMNRETASVSISYLDRFLSVHRVDKKIFQLAAMTCLYIAIKLYERDQLHPNVLARWSRGIFRGSHIVMMEKTILKALSWNLHPPTPLSFVEHFMLLLPRDPSNDDLTMLENDILQLSAFLTELSTCDYYFVTCKPSSIALASILTAIQLVDHNFHLECQFIQRLKNFKPDIHQSSNEVDECCIHLANQYTKQSSERQLHPISPASVDRA